ncbi:MAG: alpha/beta fold hydrolase [bacterium]
MGYLKIEECELYFEIEGSGHPLVFIHGGNMDRRMWDEQFFLFAEYFRVIRYDVRGFGKSTPSREPYSPGEDLYFLLNHLDIPKTHIVGLSLGGTIAIEFAISHVEMVDKLVLVGSGVGGFQFAEEGIRRQMEIMKVAQEEGTKRAVELWLQDPMMVPAMENPHISAKIRRICLENLYAYSPDFAPLKSIKPPAIHRLKEIQSPTLVIVGERDDPEILTIADILEREIPEVKKLIIPGAGHIVNMEKPGEFNKIVLDFLRN